MSQGRFRGVAKTAIIFVAISWALSSPADSPAQYQFQILHGFIYGSPDDGSHPTGVLVLDSKGNVYGTTFAGGTYNGGTVFELSPGANGQWIEAILHNFPIEEPDDGFQPVGVVLDAAGNLYGMTIQGGSNDAGIVFELSPGANGNWTEAILYNFCSLPDCADGAAPVSCQL